MDSVSLAAAFLFGFLMRLVGLPPLIGFLMAGFALNAVGAEGGELVDRAGDMGVLLLLFTIGCKLRLKNLLSPEVWAGATTHMVITIMLVGGIIVGLGALGLAAFTSLDFKAILLIAFALSFSSTVFAVKVLEEKGEMRSLHGRVADVLGDGYRCHSRLSHCTIPPMSLERSHHRPAGPAKPHRRIATGLDKPYDIISHDM